MWGHPGKKLLFMGGEFGQLREWNHDHALDWTLLDQPRHRGLQRLVADLNGIYRAHPALYAADIESAGFHWVQVDRTQHSLFAWLRFAPGEPSCIVVVCNFTPAVHTQYRVGVPRPGFYRECLNSDAAHYGGGNIGNLGGVVAEARSYDGQPFSVCIDIPPLAALYFAWEDGV